MSIPQNMARDFLATGAVDLQDAYRMAWMQNIPRQFRKSRASTAPRGKLSTTAANGPAPLGTKSLAMIAKRAPVILPLHHAGKTVLEISEIVGNGTKFVRKVIKESGFQPNRSGPYARKTKDYSKLLPRVHALRENGMSWADIGALLGVSKTNLRKAHNEWVKEASA